GPCLLDHQLHILFDQHLETLIALQGFFELRQLIGRHVAGNILTVFIALVVVVRPAGTLANDTQRALFQALDLSDLLEDGLGSGFGFHALEYMSIAYTKTTKKTKKSKIEDFCHAPGLLCVSITRPSRPGILP